ncbi:MAG: RagB/SusD family nutrient uptake outer membrane protein [Prevotella sp.]|nr:RagB/SusD family nutrient uptake outer membrane protein [Prevotella sp.]
MNIKFLKQTTKARLLKMFAILAPLTLGGAGVLTSCSDMLDTESTRQNFEPEIDQKTDSLTYAYGIMQAMQELADQYVFQGEMRGDLIATTQYTDSMLTQLANFSATTTNRYDSAYVYYRVINNCNYYIAHRNTNLYTGADNVAIVEYAAVKAFRAWAYLQLARNYKRVPFFTEPLTAISQIDNNTFPELDMAGIVAQLAPDLEQYTGYPVPIPLDGSHPIGRTNWEFAKEFLPSCCYIPVDVILGDMYIETGQYAKAAQHFVTYLKNVSTNPSTAFTADFRMKKGAEQEVTTSFTVLLSNTKWGDIFSGNSTTDIISYIPMATSARYGATTNVPLAFGADFYATPAEETGYKRLQCEDQSGVRSWSDVKLPLVSNIQIVPSDELKSLSDSTAYYYYETTSGSTTYNNIGSAFFGDMRLASVLGFYEDGDNTLQWITKYDYANIILYRNSTVLLRLAEAFNRLGMYDAAFAILKDGISAALLRPATQANSPSYMSEETKTLLQTTYPILANVAEDGDESSYKRFALGKACGIHCHGAGKAVSDMAETNYLKDSSPYTLSAVVGKKLQQMSQWKDLNGTGITIGTTKQDTINAIEDLLCDEYALELAFEGSRYYDLLRLARHKNGHSGTEFDGSPAAYGANFGGRWLAKKLENRKAVVDLSNEANWYLPFK